MKIIKIYNVGYIFCHILYHFCFLMDFSLNIYPILKFLPD